MQILFFFLKFDSQKMAIDARFQDEDEKFADESKILKFGQEQIYIKIFKVSVRPKN